MRALVLRRRTRADVAADDGSSDRGARPGRRGRGARAVRGDEARVALPARPDGRGHRRADLVRPGSARRRRRRRGVDFGQGRGWRRDVEAIASRDRRQIVYALAATWRAHSCSGTGPHPGAFTITEDDEKFTFEMNPCGSGQRLVRMGRYEGPNALGVTRSAHDWSYGREGFPLYCTHCSFMNESLPISWIGYPLYPSDPPDDFGTRSVHLVLVQGSGRHPGPALGALRADALRRPMRMPASARPQRPARDRHRCGRRHRPRDRRCAGQGGCRSRRATCPARRWPSSPGAPRRRRSTSATGPRSQAGVAEAIGVARRLRRRVANAGVVDTIHRAERFSEEEWRKDLETNLYGAFYLVQSAFEALAASGDGRMVLISSAAAPRRASPGRWPTAHPRPGWSGWPERWPPSGRRTGFAATS